MKKLRLKYREITTSVIIVAGCMIFFGDTPTNVVSLLYPANVTDFIPYDQGKIFLAFQLLKGD